MWGRALAVVTRLASSPRTLAAADQPLKPVTVTVIDVATKKPVTEFSYTLDVTAPGEVDEAREREPVKPVDVKSPTGTFVVNVPESCKIRFTLHSPPHQRWREGLWNRNRDRRPGLRHKSATLTGSGRSIDRSAVKNTYRT